MTLRRSRPFTGTARIAVTLSAALVTAAAAACSSASTSSGHAPSSHKASSPTATTGAASSTPPPKRGNADLVIWTDAQRAPVLAPFAKSFGQQNGISVSVQPVSTDLQSAYVTATTAGKGPDIVVGATDWIGNLVQNGTIGPLPLTTAQQHVFEPTAIKAVTYNGQVYGVPYATENLALFTNTAEATPAPATFEKLVANGEAAVKAGKAVDPLALQIGQSGDPYTMQPLFASAGGYLFGTKPNGTYDPAQLGVAKPGALKFAELLHKYGEKGEDVFKRSIDPTNAVSLFASGKVPYLVSGPWALPQIKKAGIKYAISPVPGFAGMGPARPFLGVQAFYVSSKAKNSALAQEFTLNYLTKPQVEEALYKVEPRPPALTAAYNDVARTDPDIAAFHKAGEDGVVLPQIPAMSAVWGPLGTAEAAIVGGADPDSTMKAAAQQIHKAIKD